MGFILWLALTALALAAGIALALRHGRQLPVAEQLVAACVAATAVVMGPILALGFAGVLYNWSTGGLVALLSLAFIYQTRNEASRWTDFAKGLKSAARNAVGSIPSAVLTLFASGLVAYLLAYVYLLPSWGWDAMNYHNTSTAYAFQDHSLQWHNTPYNLCNSYPKNLELLALWNGFFTPDDRLIDLVQLPLVLMGVLSLAALCRQTGASAAFSWSLGLCWLLMPAVFLNTPSDYVDAGAASLGLASVLFLARVDGDAGRRLFGAVALGLSAGSKVSGAMHAVLLVPLVLVSLYREYKQGTKLKSLALQVAGMIAIVLSLGGYSYFRDLYRYGNPVWPVRAHIPFSNANLPGEWDMYLLNTPPFGGPDNMEAMFRSFYELKPFYIVDVRLGGFGPLWGYVLLPCFVLVTLWALVRAFKKIPTPVVFAAVMLVLGAVLTPARWWPRYTLGFPAGGLLSVAILASLIGRQKLQPWIAGLIGLIAMVQTWPARAGFFAPPEKLAEAWSLPAIDRAHLKFDSWQQKDIALRDLVVEPGEASIYDDSVSFVYQLWRSDWKNQVLYRPLKGNAAQWTAALETEKVRWAAIQRGGPAERVLHDAGWIYLYACGSENCNVWVKPNTDLHGWVRH